jgi:hypothetical protein
MVLSSVALSSRAQEAISFHFSYRVTIAVRARGLGPTARRRRVLALPTQHSHLDGLDAAHSRQSAAKRIEHEALLDVREPPLSQPLGIVARRDLVGAFAQMCDSLKRKWCSYRSLVSLSRAERVNGLNLCRLDRRSRNAGTVTRESAISAKVSQIQSMQNPTRSSSED